MTDFIEGDYLIIESCDNIQLIENGFVEETVVQIYKIYGNIICFNIRGTRIALRDTQYNKIKFKMAL